MAAPRTPPVSVPPRLRAQYQAWRWTIMSSWPKQTTWRLELGGTPARYLKVARPGTYPPLAGEAQRTRWAAAWLPVAKVLDVGADQHAQWLVTAALAGTPSHLTDPSHARATVVALAKGLRRFHDHAPISSCPFDFRVQAALAHVQQRVAADDIDPASFNADHAHLGVASALAELLRRRPLDEDLVVCHGDYCAPNALIDGGAVAGFIDLGELGVADRWWDLAVATWSATWNFGAGLEPLFLSAYGAPPDPDRQAFYRLLYDLT